MRASPTKPSLGVTIDDTPLQRFLTYRLSQLSSKLNRQATAILRKAGGLKLPEWRVIALLATHGELNARWIGDRTGADPGLLSRTFRALELKELITARRSGEDRRAVYVTLTRKGQQVHDKTIPHMRARQRRLLDALDPGERSAVFKIIDKLEIAAEARDPAGGRK
jgi:DNA-binding MarR family transcriptional regulator